MSHPVFKYQIEVRGGLLATYIFETCKQIEDWKKTDVPFLEQKYGPLELSQSDLPALTVGDKCHVLGDGDAVYVIKGLDRWKNHRYGFILNSGRVECVSKCYPLDAEIRNDEAAKIKYALDYLGDAFRQFSRNGRWGECMECPRDNDGHAYPEFCSNTHSKDHHMTIDQLRNKWKIYAK